MLRVKVPGRSPRVLLVGLPLLFVAAFFVVPAIVIIAKSLNAPDWSLENYISFGSGPAVRQAVLSTFTLAFQSSLIAAAIGCVLISAIVQRGKVWRAVILGALLMPFVASELVRIVSWLLLLGPEGPVANALGWMGIENVNLVGSHVGALIGMVHVELPFFTLAALAPVLAVDRALTRASVGLGANRIQTFLTVTLPLVVPGLVAAWAITFVLGLGYYATPIMLGGIQEQTTIQALIMNDIGQGGSWDHAAALGILLMVVAVLGFAVLAWAGGLRVIYGGTHRSHRTPQPYGLASLWNKFAYSSRLWSRPGRALDSRVTRRMLAAVETVAVVCIILYLAAPTLAAIPSSLSSGTLLELLPSSLSMRWYRELFTDDAWAASLRTSLLVSVPAAVFATAIGLCAAIALVRRYLGVGTKFLTLMLLPMIMPIQITALGLFFVTIDIGIAFTPQALVIGYTLLGLPYAVVVLSAALQAFDWDVDRAAQSLGAAWWRRVKDVVVPVLRPALLVSLLFAFITAFSELIFALFMRSLTLTTLPVKLWTAVRYDLDPTTAAAAGLTLVASALAAGLVGVGRIRLGRGSRRGMVASDDFVHEREEVSI